MSGPASPNLAGRLRVPVLLGLILILAAILRAWHIDAAPFRLDEHLTIELANGHGFAHLDLPPDQIISPVPDYISLSAARPWQDIWKNSARDVHPPLFYMVLRAWREVWGESDAAVRALPAALSVLAIVALFIGVQAQAGATPALWASLIMALAAAQIEAAQDTRSYVLLEVCLLGACATMLRIEHHGRSWPRAVVLAGLAFAATMTHLLALPLLGTMGAYALIRLRGEPRRWVIAALAFGVVGAALVWGPYAWIQSEGYLHRTEFVRDSRWSLERWIYRITTLPLKFFVSAQTRSRLVASMGASLYMLPLLLLRQRPALAIWWLWLIVGVGSIAAADLARHGEMLDYPRYTVAISPAAYVLAALMLSHLDGWFRHIVPLLLSAACLGAIQGAYVRFNPDWRGLSMLIDRRLGEGDVLVMPDDPREPWRVRCNVVGIQYYARHKPAAILLDRLASVAVRERLRNAGHVWLFTLPGREAAYQTIFPGSRVLDFRYFEEIGTLIRVELAPEPDASPGQPPTAAPSTAPPPATLP